MMPLACGQSRGDRQSLAHHPTSLIGLLAASRHVAEVSGSSVVSPQICSDRRVASTPALLSLSPHALSSHLLMELNLVNNYIACVCYVSSLLLGGSRGCKPTNRRQEGQVLPSRCSQPHDRQRLSALTVDSINHTSSRLEEAA